MRLPRWLLAVIIAASTLGMTAFTQWIEAVEVTTQHNDIQRSGANTSETILTTGNVATATFGKLFTINLAANVNGQALYMPGLTINSAVHNVVFVYTSNNSTGSPCGIAAYDADVGGTALWSTTLTPAAQYTTNTPVIDPTTSIMYFVTKDNNDNGASWMHAVSILTGLDLTGSPVQIGGSVTGTGGGSSGGTVTFPASHANCRPGMLLVNGVVYCGFSFNTDAQPYHGWIFGYSYNGTAFTQHSIFCDSPNSEAGGIWQAGKGLASDGTNIYCTTGNGNFDNSLAAGSAFGMCVLRLSPTLSVLDYFAPSNEASESGSDQDLGNCGLTIIPGSSPSLGFVGSTKYSQGHLVNINNLGHFNGATNVNAADACLQTVSVGGAVGSNPVSWNAGGSQYVYLDGGGTLTEWQVTGGNALTQITTQSVGSGNSGLCVTSNGTTNGLLWVLGSDGSIHARDATNVATEYWSSTQNSARDAMPSGPGKFQFPMVANGKAYMPDGAAHLVAYGLLSQVATQLAFVQQPTSGATGLTLPAVTVAVENAAGTTVSTSTTSVTIALGANPGGATLSGTTTVSAVNGIATFSNLSLNMPGVGYTLVASVTGLTGATSSAFTVSSQVAAPAISPNGGATFTGPVTVRLSDATANATIYYTTNGTPPTTSSSVYNPASPPQLTTSATVEAYATDTTAGLTPSAVTTASFTIAGTTAYGMPYRPVVTGVTMPATNTNPPATLSATGLFTTVDTATNTFTPTPGIVPYTVITPLWSDAAQKQRWIALPGASQIGFQPTGVTPWAFPGGTIFIKNFALVVDSTTNPVQTQMLETRVLVVDSTGTNGYGVSYQWLPSNTADASLAPAAGVNENISVTTAAGTSTQVWSIPSQANCLVCHTRNAGFVLGVKTGQLNGTITYPSTGVTDNQLRTWNYLQMFTTNICAGTGEAGIAAMQQFVPDTSTTAPLQTRVKCYLDANCAQCHRPGGANTAWDARYDTPMASQGIINGAVGTTLGIPGAMVVVPQQLSLSMMDLRMRSTNAATQMPPLARNVVDATGCAVLEQWINTLTPNPPTITAMSPTTGPTGTVVVLTGTCLTGATAVTYTGTAVPYTVVSTLAITATIPAGASNGTFTVTVPGGHATSGTFTINGAAIPAPTITTLLPTAGSSGSTVLIDGANFNGTTAVSFHGVAASFTVLSNTQVSAVVPASATTGTVSLTTPGGTATSPGSFTVVAAGTVPLITSVTPAAGAVGSQVTIVGTDLTGAQTVSFNGALATFTINGSGTQIIATVPTGATSGNIVVVAPQGTAVSPTLFTVTPPSPPSSSSGKSCGSGILTVLTMLILTSILRRMRLRSRDA